MAKKSLEKFFKLNFSSYCGIFLREKTAKKVAKLLHKQNQQLKELLYNNLNDLEEVNWTLAYPNKKQRTVYYYKTHNEEDIIRRISLCDKQNIEFVKDGVYIGDSEEDIIKEYEKLDEYI